MLNKIKEWLKGKKTYLTAVTTIIGALVAYGEGIVGLEATIQAIVTAILAMTIRAGISNG